MEHEVIIAKPKAGVIRQENKESLDLDRTEKVVVHSTFSSFVY